MVLAYDNWERLVEATLKREQFRQLCRQISRSSSSVSTLSDFSFMSSNPEGSSSLQQNFPATQPAIINSRESKSQKKEKSVSKVEPKLVFVKGYNLAIELQDLLRAPSTFLGKGAFGTAYMAALSNGVRVVVKRLRELSVDETEFKRQMEVTASIRHENVVPLRGYCTFKDNKLMLYDYYSHGSVHAMLREKRSKDQILLDWETRLGIVIGAATGIAHIHAQCDGKLVHGNIKASNIFLNSQQYGCVSDLGLATLVTPIGPPVMRTAGYRVPETINTRKVSQASDVYSFGIVILELLTGKSPSRAGVLNLVKWVRSIVQKEGTTKVFDSELLHFPDKEEEMVNMLQIALSCVARKPEQRPKMLAIVTMVKNIRRTNAGSYSSS
ncbi:probable inactive receptor kinase At4g23740 [Olea europaea subsp. europaea]|uniref:Probable inactive receptor kinase At4g23740 n=1 Tax=Olea europaea subsp. europaea TaxID=158383 RepID=A0A8S0TCI4_OLEEU|nr:probable inactive receptor kinase At4g23740 [Olea europaea subsp. europaea]